MSTSGAQVVIFSADQRQVLLIKREDFRIWTVPGGRVEAGESPEAAGQREVLEETGYTVAIDRLVGEYWRPQMADGGARVYAYVGHITGGDSTQHGWESLAVEWFDVDQLPARMVGFAREVLNDARANLPAPVQRVQRLSFWRNLVLQSGLRIRNLRNRWRQRS